MKQLSNVSYVILGFLKSEPQTGYDIKQKVDYSTRHFFAASYGQIYPDLKKLEAAGLVVGQDKAEGGRARIEYSITAAGLSTLAEWVIEPATKLELRDEALLHLFFSDDLSNDQKIAKLTEMQADRKTSLDGLVALHEEIADSIPPMTLLTLEYGLGFYRHAIDWCERAIAELTPS